MNFSYGGCGCGGPCVYFGGGGGGGGGGGKDGFVRIDAMEERAKRAERDRAALLSALKGVVRKHRSPLRRIQARLRAMKVIERMSTDI